MQKSALIRRKKCFIEQMKTEFIQTINSIHLPNQKNQKLKVKGNLKLVLTTEMATTAKVLMLQDLQQ